MQTAVVEMVVVAAMWLIRLPDIGNQTVRSKSALTSTKFVFQHASYMRKVPGVIAHGPGLLH